MSLPLPRYDSLNGRIRIKMLFPSHARPIGIQKIAQSGWTDVGQKRQCDGEGLVG
jgi:hypothetical protein